MKRHQCLATLLSLFIILTVVGLAAKPALAHEGGEYTVGLLPTVRGQYSVCLFGAIGDTEVEEVVEPEEVVSAESSQFPEPQPDIRQLQLETQQQMAELQSQVQRR
jgi:hypothetical protein